MHQETDRVKAMTWWNSLRVTRLENGTKDRGYYTDIYFGYNERIHKYLTGREIELIWNKYINIK